MESQMDGSFKKSNCCFCIFQIPFCDIVCCGTAFYSDDISNFFVICLLFYLTLDGFGGLVVSMLASGTQVFAGSNPVEAVGFIGCKNPQHASLRRGSKRICPMSQL